MKIKMKLFKGGILPVFKTEGAVAADCYANNEDAITIPSGKRALVPLGFAMELPNGYEAVIRPRSGLTSKGIDIGIGTIDCDYRGEVKACVINNSDAEFIVPGSFRICQIAIREVPETEFIIVNELSETERGSGGFGHTGVK